MIEGSAAETTDRFVDREDAGRQLADLVAPLIESDDAVVLALPRGGVPVGREVAERLGAPLDILLVRKLGVPWQPELAFGAIASGGVVVLNEDHLRAIGMSEEVVKDTIERERHELTRREELYHNGTPLADVEGKTVVVVDDGIATGSTVRAALESLEQRGVARRIVACPVAAAETLRALQEEADEVVVLRKPVAFTAVGAWYDDFAPISDSEVKHYLGYGQTAA